MATEGTPQELGVRFAEQVLGTTVRQGPPPADTPLARVQAYVAEHGGDALTPERFAALRDGLPVPD